jgi:hypothetical protein
MKRPAAVLFAAVLAPTLILVGRTAPKPAPSLFQTSDRCFACHNGLSSPAGEDVSIGLDWRPTMMANSSRDPYWQAGVRRETIDHPESAKAIEDECATCHMPMSRFQARAAGREGEIFAHLPFDSKKPADRLAEDGVSCSLCHQIDESKLGTRESFAGGFVVDTTRPKGERREYGPFKIEAGQNRIMRSSSGGYQPTEGKHIRQSELCATCHTLYTKALGPNGQVIGELPEQMPYQEWLESDFKEKRSCQSCHMPVVKGEMRIANTLGQPREGLSRHVFLGGNFFMLRMLSRFRGELQVAALPQELDAAAVRTVQHLQSQTAELAIDRVDGGTGRVAVDVAVRNLSGHKFPTAYPSRRAWLHLVIRDRDGRTVFESGALQPGGSIKGNDNDADPARFEPHYAEILNADQVQIYESIMVDQSGKPTTGLLSAVRFIKDNRLLPRGFRKQAADKDIAVQGGAAADPDFVGGEDRVRYTVALGQAAGPFEIEAELWFQPISYRWAANLKTYDAPEPLRFRRYYDSLSEGTAVLVARTVTRSR